MIEEIIKTDCVIVVDLKSIMKQRKKSVYGLSKETGIRYHIVKKYYANSEDSFDSFRQLVSVSGDPSLVGCFDYRGGTALYVVNNTFDEHRGEITLTFDRAYECEVIQRGVVGSIVSKKFVVTLEAGEGALVVLK